MIQGGDEGDSDEGVLEGALYPSSSWKSADDIISLI